MNNKIFFLVSFIALVSGFIVCDNNDPDTGEDTGKSVVGYWEEIIPATAPYIPDTLEIHLVIKDSDSSFFLTVIERAPVNSDTLYKHSGSWRINNNDVPEDSLYLYGEECSIIDTTADPDTLKSLHDTICTDTVVLDTTGSSSDKWVIKMKSLTPFLEAFLSPDLIPMLSLMDLYMDRKNTPEVRF